MADAQRGVAALWAAVQAPPRSLSYAGDVTETVLAHGGQVMGPNNLGEYLQVVSAEFDAVARRTLVRFRYLRREEEHLICRDEVGLLRLAQLAGAR
jgi:hypothetical protein